MLAAGAFPFARNVAAYLGAVVVSFTIVALKRHVPLITGAGALAALVVPWAVRPWHQGPGWLEALMIVFTALTVHAFLEMANANLALVEARAEVARPASEAERARIARDLHDLHGHSLTVITVKSNLARRMAATDPARSLEEITEVESLSRQALADVRAAVSGYRNVTLAGELARGRELFGWIVREGLTNVVRHARHPLHGHADGDTGGDPRRRLRWAVRPPALLARARADGPARTRRGCGRHAGGRARPRRGQPGRRARPAAARYARPGARGRPGGRGRGMTIRLLLADDQELIRTALAALLGLEDDFEVVASVGWGDEVADAVRAHRPDVALLDIEMPGLDGLAAAAVLAARAPRVRVVILTTFGRAGYLRRAMEAGAVGFVVKDAPAEALADAIRRVAAGERVADPALAAATLAVGESPLTGRERDVLNVARGGRPSPRSRPGCTCRRARSATTCRPRSPRPRPATAWRRCGSPTSAAGSERSARVSAGTCRPATPGAPAAARPGGRGRRGPGPPAAAPRWRCAARPPG